MSEPTSADGGLRPWVEVHALAAEHGDCIVLSYGDGKANFRLVVDAGVAGTADRIKRVLDASDDAVWELLVVTHIDLDHIGGTLSLLSDKSIAIRFKDIWFNGRQHLELGRESMAVADGKQLAELLGREGISWNEAFGKDAVCLAADDTPVCKTLPVSKAAITILSPSTKGLAKLRQLWDLCEEREKRKAEQPTKAKSAAVRQDAPYVEVLSAVPLSIAAMADTKTGTDDSVTNGSSIAFIFEYAGFRILLGADAHASVLLKSTAKLSPETLNLDVFKLPHHGSSANVTKRLAQMLPARRYLLTTDGARHDTHPSDVAIARVLTVTSDAELLFNYSNEAYRRWADRPPKHGYPFKVRAGQGEEGIRVRLEVEPSQGTP
jgi:beta-lactamase superfamily II metal-dependent hydrolase